MERNALWLQMADCGQPVTKYEALRTRSDTSGRSVERGRIDPTNSQHQVPSAPFRVFVTAPAEREDLVLRRCWARNESLVLRT